MRNIGFIAESLDVEAGGRFRAELERLEPPLRLLVVLIGAPVVTRWAELNQSDDRHQREGTGERDPEGPAESCIGRSFLVMT